MNYLSMAQVAKKLGISVRSLYRMGDKGPPFHRLTPRKVVYLQEEVDAWVKAQTR